MSVSQIYRLEDQLQRLDLYQHPNPSLMELAGSSLARLCLALAPHAQLIWIACGPGNNGGDGLVAAVHLVKMGKKVHLSLYSKQPPDTRAPGSEMSRDAFEFNHADALRQARALGIHIRNDAPTKWDVAIDALLGIGVARQDLSAKQGLSSIPERLIDPTLQGPTQQSAPRAIEGVMAEWLCAMRSSAAPLICADLPSGLNPETGAVADLSCHCARCTEHINPSPVIQKRYTLTFLGIKPGLFTHSGKDFSGEVWFDDLGQSQTPDSSQSNEPRMGLNPAPTALRRAHSTHKGTYSEVTVVGGAPSMQGAAVLAASSALHMGAGKVYLALIDPSWLAHRINASIMRRDLNALKDSGAWNLQTGVYVYGCGAGITQGPWLEQLLKLAKRMVLDADGINELAQNESLKVILSERRKHNMQTILTPHPLEAARLLGTSVQQVQNDRIQSAKQLCETLACIVVLKGAGTVIARPNSSANHLKPPMSVCINTSGNPLLASAGTGDVLAGMIGALWAQSDSDWESACEGVYLHGLAADQWPIGESFDAQKLAERVSYLRPLH